MNIETVKDKLEIGDVVTLKKDKELMTVEKIKDNKATLLWFRGSTLYKEIFNIEELNFVS